jgi:hypothetical protein
MKRELREKDLEWLGGGAEKRTKDNNLPQYKV